MERSRGGFLLLLFLSDSLVEETTSCVGIMVYDMAANEKDALRGVESSQRIER